MPKQQRKTKPVPPTKSARKFAAAITPIPSSDLPVIAIEPRPSRLLDRATVLQRVPVTYATLWTWMRRGEFPRSVNVGGKVCWREHEIEAWIASRPRQPIKAVEAVDS